MNYIPKKCLLAIIKTSCFDFKNCIASDEDLLKCPRPILSPTSIYIKTFIYKIIKLSTYFKGY